MPGFFCARDVIVRCGSARAAIAAIDTVDVTVRGPRGVSRYERRGVAISALGVASTAMRSVSAAIGCAGVRVW